MDKIVWFFKEFDNFPRRAQLFFGLAFMEIAMVILLLVTGSFVWVLGFVVAFLTAEAVLRVNWGGKSMEQILAEHADKLKEEAEQE